MNTITLRAHFDGEQIRLDEPYELPPDVPLLVMVLPLEMMSGAEEREAWMLGAEQALAQAYGEDEPEYTLDMIREPNPKYDGR